MLTMKHGFLITSVKMLKTAQNFTGLVTMQTSTYLSVLWGVIKYRCQWRQIIRHQVSSKVCSSNILLLFQAFLLSFLLSSHIQASSVHVSFQSKFFTFFLHITFQHSSLASAFQHKAFPLAISSGIAFSSACFCAIFAIKICFTISS